MPIFTKSGRVVMAESISLRPIHLAWGCGNGAWTTTVPPEKVDAAGLMNEVGRRVAAVGFVTPNPAGDIVLPNGIFSTSATPTNHLHLKAKFTFSDASSEVIREIGAFVGTELIPGLPPGQEYFLPSEVASPGRLLHLEHFVPIFRSPAIEETFEVVVTF